jgi:hypothetical protein
MSFEQTLVKRKLKIDWASLQDGSIAPQPKA